MNRTILLCLTGLALVAGRSWSGPLFDPFLERFQVGEYRDPSTIAMTQGFPSDLLEPAWLDTAWVAGARRVLSDRGTPDTPFVTLRILDRYLDKDAREAWLDRMAGVLDQLETGATPVDWDHDHAPLLAARATRAVFTQLTAGRVMQAAAMAIRLRDHGPELGFSARQIFVWDLRAKLLFRLSGNRAPRGASCWPTMLDLGPYDTGNAWALWTAYCRETDTTPLPAVMSTEKWGRHLARISRSWLSPAELYQSGLPREFQAGLGAVFFKGAVRDAHFQKFPLPPRDNSLQGLWIRGKRLQSGGDAATYEQLADRPDLKPGWRLDLWRRASEIRLLDGQWTRGLADLRQALQLAGVGAGTRSTRRRLRQWNEQALVLALAQGDPATARQLRELGLEHFKGDDRKSFRTETDHWLDRLDVEADRMPDPGNHIPELARALIEKGQAPDLGPVSATRREQFQLSAARSLWGLWTTWGITLANPEAVQGRKRQRAISYRDALLAMAEQPASGDRESSALEIIAERLGDNPVFYTLLSEAFDRDVVRAAGGRTPPAPSVIPVVLPQLRGSELDRHALLGFALALGDMRGILAVATGLAGRGLTPEEKRRFLYPLPRDGAIQASITLARSDPALLLAVARNESLFEPSVRSRAGALGWMQIMPFHYDERGALPGASNWRNPGISIRHGDVLLQENTRRYEGDPYLAVAAYNAGPRAASRWLKQLGGTPERDIYLAWIGYPETRHYVEKVLIDRQIYDWIIRTEFPD